jgi:pseudouridine kinase
MSVNIAVVGTVFVDCKGFARQKYDASGRNLGDIKFIHGGVGRNVVENIANLGLPTMFISSVDRTALGKEVIARLGEIGVDTSCVLEQDQTGMGMWLAILNEQGELAGSISQMPTLETLEAFITQQGNAVLQKATHVVLELDLNVEIAKKVIHLAALQGSPIYGIPGNLSVVLSNLELLRNLDCFICNEVEAQHLLGVPFMDCNIDQMQEQLKQFAFRVGLKSMVVTLGSRGSVYYESKFGTGYQPVFSVQVVDSSGAGDSFFSGTVVGLVSGKTLSQSVEYGSKVAAWTIQCTENTCSDLMIKIKQDDLFREYCRAIVSA